jgi:hypothetical protein
MVGIEFDDITAKQLLEIGGHHYKLIFEFGNKNTFDESMYEIIKGIQSLQITRESIFEELKKSNKMSFYPYFNLAKIFWNFTNFCVSYKRKNEPFLVFL